MKPQARLSPWTFISNFLIASGAFFLWHLWFGVTTSIGTALSFGLFYILVQFGIILLSIPFILIFGLLYMAVKK